jgi:hypothetical protein
MVVSFAGPPAMKERPGTQAPPRRLVLFGGNDEPSEKAATPSAANADTVSLTGEQGTPKADEQKSPMREKTPSQPGPLTRIKNAVREFVQHFVEKFEQILKHMRQDLRKQWEKDLQKTNLLIRFEMEHLIKANDEKDLNWLGNWLGIKGADRRLNRLFKHLKRMSDRSLNALKHQEDNPVTRERKAALETFSRHCADWTKKSPEKKLQDAHSWLDEEKADSPPSSRPEMGEKAESSETESPSHETKRK